MPLYQLQNSVLAGQFRVKFKDIFSIGDFYEMLHFVLLEEGWSSADSRGNLEEGEEFFETNYIERVGGSGAKDQVWWWRLQKIPFGNSYYKYHLDIDFLTIAMESTEVMREGKKFKANKGTIEIFGFAYIEYDVGNKWSNHPLLSMFQKIFPERIFKKDLFEKHKLELYRESYTLQAWIKKYFKLKNFLPYEEVSQFHPAKSYPSWKKE